jgi:hypothetical protein
MDSLIEVAVAICSGALGVLLFRFFKPNVKKQNAEVIVKVDKIEKENKELEKKVEENKSNAQKHSDELEKEKEKDLSAEGLADYFNNRKDS